MANKLFLKAWVFCLTLSSCQAIATLPQTTSSPSKHPRVISLTPHLTQMMIDLGVENWLVGIDKSSYSLFENLNSLPIAGNFQQIHIERVIGLKPNWLLSWQDSASSMQLKVLTKRSIKVFNARPNRLSDIAKDYQSLSSTLGTPRYEHMKIQNHLSQIQSQLQSIQLPSLKALFVIWHQPIFSLRASHWLAEAFAQCGLSPITLPNESSPSSAINDEFVLQQAPDVVLTPSDLSNSNLPHSLQALTKKQTKFVFYNGKLASQPTLKMLEEVLSVCTRLATTLHQHPVDGRSNELK